MLQVKVGYYYRDINGFYVRILGEARTPETMFCGVILDKNGRDLDKVGLYSPIGISTSDQEDLVCEYPHPSTFMTSREYWVCPVFNRGLLAGVRHGVVYESPEEAKRDNILPKDLIMIKTCPDPNIPVEILNSVELHKDEA